MALKFFQKRGYAALAITLLLVGCAASSTVSSRKSTAQTTLPNVSKFSQRGEASWYGRKFHGRRTASGERYNMHALTAAHRTLPFASYVRVTNLVNGKHVVVRINDRGPFHSKRIIDLSYGAARAIGLKSTTPVEIRGLRKP